MSYQVKTRGFEGPFDLLLHLIATRELDIYEVSLAAITEDYLAHLNAMAELDLDVATEFLVVAATLIELKASRLLPGPPRDEEDLLAISERDLLIARLLEYKAFKDAAARLREIMAENAGYLGREAGPGAELAHLCPDLMTRTSPEHLAELARRALSPKRAPVVDTSHIAPIRVSVAEAVEELRAVLARRERASFAQLTRSCRSRIEVVVRFLALLELIKRGEADVEQAERFGGISAVWLGHTSPGPVVDEYEDAVEVGEE
jgi:segregation and condensation protein A